MTLTVNLQRAIQMHMMKTIDTGMMMGGLEENIILVLILQLQQALVRQQRAMMVAISISISIMIVLRQVLALVQQLVVAAIIMIVLRQVLAGKYGTTTIPYHIIKSKRIRTSEIIVESDKVTIRTPLNKSKSDIEGIISGKASWILKKQKEYKETIPQIIKPTYEEGSTLPYLGKNYPLRIIKNRSEYNIKFCDGEFIIEIKSAKAPPAKIKKIYEKWLIEKAKSVFKRKVDEYSEKLGINIERIVIKNLKNRWGSMTKEGAINLNVNLLKAPEDVIDYIILHELCHLKVKEHSHHYWDYVRRYMTNYQEKIEWLKVEVI
jgi:predicted metal-dependent hydrolase